MRILVNIYAIYLIIHPIVNTIKLSAEIKQAYWDDYLAGLYTLAEAIPLVRHALDGMQATLGANNDPGLDAVFSDVVASITNRIPSELRPKFDALKLSTDKLSWLTVSKESPNCGKKPELCRKLEQLREQLSDARVMDAYVTAQELRNMKGAEGFEVTKQLVFVAGMMMYDLSTPEACVPLWPAGTKLDLNTKLKIVDGVLSIIKEGNKHTKETKFCKLLSLKENDITCVYALTAIGFAPVRASIDTVKDSKQKEELQFCINGQLDPCSVVRGLPPSRKILKRMHQDFEEKCKWGRGVEEIMLACPNPKASLSLHRSFAKSEIDGIIQDDLARDEKWFWVHIYTQQCGNARPLIDHWMAKIDNPDGDTAFALSRMQEAIRSCENIKISGLNRKEKELGVIRLLTEGNLEEAIAKIHAAGKLSDEIKTYYEVVIRMLNHPRVLDISGLVTKPLLVPNKMEENVRLMRTLDQIFDNEEIEENLPEETAALLLLLTAKYDNLLAKYEQRTLKGPINPVMSELMGTARICQATRKSLCSDVMKTHVKRALEQLRLRPKKTLYEDILEELCNKTEETKRTSIDDTNLFKMIANWGQLYGHTGRYFKFPNDSLEGIGANIIAKVKIHEKKESNEDSDGEEPTGEDTERNSQSKEETPKEKEESESKEEEKEVIEEEKEQLGTDEETDREPEAEAEIGNETEELIRTGANNEVEIDADEEERHNGMERVAQDATEAQQSPQEEHAADVIVEVNDEPKTNEDQSFVNYIGPGDEYDPESHDRMVEGPEQASSDNNEDKHNDLEDFDPNSPETEPPEFVSNSEDDNEKYHEEFDLATGIPNSI